MDVFIPLKTDCKFTFFSRVFRGKLLTVVDYIRVPALGIELAFFY